MGVKINSWQWLVSALVVAQVFAAALCAGGQVYPLKASSNGRYLVDQTGKPFLIIGDAPHSLVVNVTSYQAAMYLTNRVAYGINTLWVELLCTEYTGGRPNGSLIDGTTIPFTNMLNGNVPDLTIPNEAYFAHVDEIVRMAATNGIQVLLDSLDTGDWTGVALTNGTDRCRQYGQYLGQRYKDFPNIIWITGNDYQTWMIPTNDAVVTAVALGIKDRDTNHLQTTELSYNISHSLNDTNWIPIIQIDSVYTYYATYVETLNAWNENTILPVLFEEGAYEFEYYNGEGGSPSNLRRQEYWSLLSGALAGHMYGNHFTWTFDDGWQDYLDTVGARQLSQFGNFFRNRAWYNLVPDQYHAALIAGYGTFGSFNTLNENSDYATAARSDDGSLVVVYTPINHTLTIDMSTLSGPATARWFDPAGGTYLPITGSPFANSGTQTFTTPGTNSDGDTDWVLVLETGVNPLQILTGSLPSATAGVPYSSQILATGGSPPYSWSLGLDSPPGLTFSTNGLLSGLPATAGGFTVAAQVLDSTNAFASKNFALYVSLLDTTPPTVPTGLTASATGSSQVNVSWQASTDNVGVTGYLVERSQGAGSTTFVQVGTPVGTTFNDTDLTAGTVYNYRVRATDAAGNLSGYSSVATATTSNTPPATGLAAAYGFNEGSGTTVTDASGDGDTGTISGATWTTTGKFGDALLFNGTSGYVNLGNPASLKLTGSMTLEAWVMATGNPPDDGSIVAKSSDSSPLFGWQFKTTPDTGKRTFGMGVSPNGSSITQRYGKTVLSLNTWYHVAGVYNASAQTLDIYVNGVLDDGTLNGTIPASQYDPNTNVTIGKRADGYYFKGTIDEVRIYSRALSQAEIQTDMNTAVGSSPVLDTTPPTVPTGLTASATGSSQVNVSWQASTDNVGVTGYLVERSQGAGSTTFVQVGTPVGTTFNDTGLTAGTVYNYRVRATDAAGNLSGYSSVASATTQSAADTTPPTVPTGLTASAAGSSQVNVSWQASTDNVGVTGYLVERSQGAGSTTFVQVGTPVGTTFNDTDLTAGTVYNYRVRATDAAGNLSGYSSVASATTQSAADTTPPTVPTGLTASATGSSQVNVSWQASTDNVGVTGYLVERSQGAGSTTFVQVGTPVGTTFNDTDLTAGTVYNYRVRATDAAGNLSGYSSVATATTSNTPPATGLAAAYGFNEGSRTTVTDASGDGDTGTISGATWTTTGKFGDALLFNGTSGYVNLGNPASLKLTGSMTLEAWVMATGNPPDDGSIAAKSSDSSPLFGWQFKTTPDTGKRTFGMGVSPNGSSITQRYGKTVLSLNTWYHVAGVYNASAQTLDIYVNGVLDDGTLSGTIPASQYDPNTNVTIGKRADGYYFKGTIDEVRIYSRALSQAEIQTDMNTAVGSSPVLDTTPPTVPTGLTASATGSSQVNVSWQASTDNVGVTGYLVERSQGAGSTTFVQVGTPVGTTFNDTDLTAGTVYNYRVRATDAAGNLSGYSSVASATTQSAADTTPPTVPTGLTASATGSSQVNVSWQASTDNVGVTGYLVERRRGNSSSFVQIGTPTGTTFSDTGLSARTSYSYRVRATDATGNLSGYSSIASATTTR